MSKNGMEDRVVFDRYSIGKFLQIVAALVATPAAIFTGHLFALGDLSSNTVDERTIVLVIVTIMVFAATGFIGKRLTILVPPLLFSMGIASGYYSGLWLLLAVFVTGHPYAVTAYFCFLLFGLVSLGCFVLLVVYRRQFLDEN
jgi:hypothetical protein